jgi:hypothetical protein
VIVFAATVAAGTLMYPSESCFEALLEPVSRFAANVSECAFTGESE